MARLLVIACSARKVPISRRIAAIERYDGPAFRVLRKYLRDNPNAELIVMVLSAKFGLIPATRRIPNYDLRLTAASADRMRPATLNRLRTAVAATTYLEVAFCLGKDYQRAVAGHGDAIPATTSVVTISGGLGPRLSNLRDWLRKPVADSVT